MGFSGTTVTSKRLFCNCDCRDPVFHFGFQVIVFIILKEELTCELLQEGKGLYMIVVTLLLYPLKKFFLFLLIFAFC